MNSPENRLSRPVLTAIFRTASPARLGLLVAVLVLIMQFSDPLGDVSLADSLTFWSGRLAALLLSLAASAWITTQCLANRFATPVWLKPAVIFVLIAVLPMTLAETYLELVVPQTDAYDDSVLRSRSPILAFVGEYLTIVSVVLPVNVLLWVVVDQRDAFPAKTAHAQPPRQPGFLAKTHGVTVDDVIALSAEEHYVRVITRAGSELIYARFGDAVAEMPEAAGLRVHRSWWVADRGVVQARRGERRYELELCDGSMVPVSDSYTRRARERGLLKASRRPSSEA